MTAIRQYQLVTFFPLAFALPWLVWARRAPGVPVGALHLMSTWFVTLAAVRAGLEGPGLSSGALAHRMTNDSAGARR